MVPVERCTTADQERPSCDECCKVGRAYPTYPWSLSVTGSTKTVLMLNDFALLQKRFVALLRIFVKDISKFDLLLQMDRNYYSNRPAPKLALLEAGHPSPTPKNGLFLGAGEG